MDIKSSKWGFTLLELLLVISILGILAALVTGNYISSLKKGRDAARKADLESIQKGLELYYQDKTAYPLSITFGNKFCETSGCSSAEQVYMQKIPNDPKTGVNYEYSSDGTYYRLYACLENTEQILPIISDNSSMSCATNCKDSSNNPVSCIYGISSSNTTP